MATKQLQFDCGTPFPPTRISIRKTQKPRDERSQLPKSVRTRRPSAIDAALAKQDAPFSKPAILPKSANYNIAKPSLPPVKANAAASETWLRIHPAYRRVYDRRDPSQNLTSDISLGILDYYLNTSSTGSSPKCSQDTPYIDARVIVPALEKFHFELTPFRLSLSWAHDAPALTKLDATLQAQPGAENAQDSLIDFMPPARMQRQDTFSLFPSLNVTMPTRPPPDRTVPAIPPRDFLCSPPSRNTLVTSPQRPEAVLHHDPHQISSIPFDTHPSAVQDLDLQLTALPIPAPNRRISFVPSHREPNAPPRRPHRDSGSTSMQTRKDSFLSTNGTIRIPKKVLSSSTRSTTTTTTTTSNKTASYTSTTSPAPTYPACFFEDDEDDDEDDNVVDMCHASAPLRSKFRWQMPLRVSPEGGHTAGSTMECFRDRRRGFGRRVGRAVVCACCYGRM